MVSIDPMSSGDTAIYSLSVLWTQEMETDGVPPDDVPKIKKYWA